MLYNVLLLLLARSFVLPFFSQSGDRNVTTLFDRFIGAPSHLRENSFFSRFSRDN